MLRPERDATRPWTVQAGLRRLAALACAGVLTGCATGGATGTPTTAFVSINRIEQELRRGVSTKTDVQRVLGTPKGYGSMVFPRDRREIEVWYYEDMTLRGVRVDGDGLRRADVRQQVLLVMFDKNTLDGFIWFTNADQVRGK